MTTKQKTQDLEKFLKNCELNKKYFIFAHFFEDGYKYQLSSYRTDGSLDTHSNIMTYKEFTAYLFGYYDCKMNKF